MDQPIEIIPAILPKDFFDLEDAVASVQALVDMVQVDVCDGKFVSSRTWPYTAGAPEEDDIFKEILNEDRGLPSWSDVDYEIHLMVEDPDRVIPDWVNAGASRIVVPSEKIQDMQHFIESYGEWVEIVPNINIDTPISIIEPYAHMIKSVQIMAIAKIGYHGSPFDERVISKIKEIKERFPHVVIAVDGAVSESTIPVLAQAGATRFAVGGAIFDSPNYAQAIKNLRNNAAV